MTPNVDLPLRFEFYCPRKGPFFAAQSAKKRTRLANRKKRWRGRQEAGRETVVPKAWFQIFIENVTTRYIIAFQII